VTFTKFISMKLYCKIDAKSYLLVPDLKLIFINTLYIGYNFLYVIKFVKRIRRTSSCIRVHLWTVVVLPLCLLSTLGKTI